MKPYYFTTFLLFITLNLSCAQENTPPIEISSKTNYTYETIIDGINIPWGLDFINNEEFEENNLYPDFFFHLSFNDN